MQILLFLAVLPSILLAYRVLTYDRIEKEPAGLLAKLFGLGMLSCVPASIIEAIGEIGIVSIVGDSGLLYSALTYLILVPLAEESCKYFMLRTTHDNPEFNYTFDGIVYGTMVALGFATLENVLYIAGYQTLATAIMRGILSVPLHCACGIFMGYCYGVAHGQEVRGSEEEAARARRLALIVPWVIHGLYDFSLDMESLPLFIFGILLTAVFFWIAARQVHIASANDAPIMVSLPERGTPIMSEMSPAPKWSNKGTQPPPFNSDKQQK